MLSVLWGRALLAFLLAAGFGLPLVATSAPGETGENPVQVAEPQDVVLPSGSRTGPPTARIGGANRYAVAVNISRHRFADAATARTVYLTRGDVFADALTAGTLEDGPVLLVRPGCDVIPGVVLQEIARLNPDRVIALGGTDSVCDATLSTAAAGRPTGRLGGQDRFEAAASIAGHAFPRGAGTVYLASGAVTSDAVVGGALRDGPILLATLDGSGVPDATLAAIGSLAPARVVALGGPVSVTPEALNLAAQGRAQDRIGGANRYEVARNIADRVYPSGSPRVYLARGDGTNFTDAVVSGMLVDGPVLLTPGTCEPVNRLTRAELGQRRPDNVIALGGPATLCQASLAGASIAARGPVDCARTKCVAITFDDGPQGRTPEVLDFFAGSRVPATFYLLGRSIATSPEVARRVHIEGHEVGNHTYDHIRLNLLSRAEQQDQLDRMDTIARQVGLPRPATMRPPHLAFNDDTRLVDRPIIIADVNPDDHLSPAPERIRQIIRDGVRPGSIILLHDAVLNTYTALPGVIADLHAQGYTFVTVSELVPGMGPGDLVYNRDTIIRRGTPASMADRIELPDGTLIGPMIDTSGVPGLTPDISAERLLGSGE